MTRWLPWLVVLLPGGAGIVIAVAVYRRWKARAIEAAEIDLLTGSPRYRYTFEGADEALQIRTAKKRDAAAGIRRRAASVESGSRVADVLRMVK